MKLNPKIQYMYKNSKKFFLFIITFLFVLSTFSQNRSRSTNNQNETNNKTDVNSIKSNSSENKLKQDLVKYKHFSYGKLLKFAKQLEEEGSLVNSVEYYELAHKKKPKNKFILQKISQLNYKLRDYISCEEYTQKLLDVDSKYDKEANMRLAMSMKANKKYREALDIFKSLALDKKQGKNAKKIDAELRGCELALELGTKTDLKINVANISQLNGNLQEYAPQPLGDYSIVYSSIVSDTALNITQMKKEGKDYTSKLLFSAYDNEMGQWSKPQLLPSEINLSNVFIGNSYMDNDGKTIYYTQCVEDKKLEMQCKLFIAEKIDGKWKTEELKNLNVKGSNTQPAIYENDKEKYLFFSSNRQGGKGGFDIYYTQLDAKGRPSKETYNLKEVNSFGNDITPFYDSKTKTLYFSSDGYPTVGGMDIFKIKGKLGSWEKVLNLKYPINSSLDDIYFKLKEESEGYFVSNRGGSKSPRGLTCCDDLWSVTKNEFTIHLKGIYASSADPERLPLNGVTVLIVEDSTNKTILDKTTENNNHFITKLNVNKKYKVNGVKEGFYPGIENFNTPKEIFRNDTLYKVFLLDPIEKKRYVVENVYYAFDKSVVRPEYYSIMDSVASLLNIFENTFLKIDGHTDSRGTVQYNQDLSERRCKAAAEYLLLKNVDPERIIMRGYSEEVPIAPNETPSGEDDPAGRAKNRRVEFKLLSPNGKDPNLDIDYRVNIPFNNE